MDYSIIGKNIRKIRTEKKMRKDDLAEKTNLSPNYIGAVERNEIALFDNSSHFLIKPTFYQKVHRGGFTLSSGIYCPKTP